MWEICFNFSIDFRPFLHVYMSMLKKMPQTKQKGSQADMLRGKCWQADTRVRSNQEWRTTRIDFSQTQTTPLPPQTQTQTQICKQQESPISTEIEVKKNEWRIYNYCKVHIVLHTAWTLRLLYWRSLSISARKKMHPLQYVNTMIYNNPIFWPE